MFRKKNKFGWKSQANNFEIHFNVNGNRHVVVLYAMNRASALGKFWLLYAGDYDGKITDINIKIFKDD